MLEKRTPIPVDEAVRRVCHFQKQGGDRKSVV